ncbi:MAG: hypothetical protein AB7V26_03395 [Lysobacterales bacterium]
MEPALTALTQRYLVALPEKRAEIERVYQASQVPGEMTVNRVLLQGMLDRLSGSAGAYGFVALGEAARTACAQIEADHNLLVPAAMDGVRIQNFAKIMKRVLDCFDAILAEPPQPPPA